MSTPETDLPSYYIRPALWPLVPLLGLTGWFHIASGGPVGIIGGAIVILIALYCLGGVIATIGWLHRRKAWIRRRKA